MYITLIICPTRSLYRMFIVG